MNKSDKSHGWMARQNYRHYFREMRLGKWVFADDGTIAAAALKSLMDRDPKTARQQYNDARRWLHGADVGYHPSTHFIELARKSAPLHPMNRDEYKWVNESLSKRYAKRRLLVAIMGANWETKK